MRRYALSVEAPLFFGPGEPTAASNAERGAATNANVGAVNWDPSKQALGDRLHPRVRALHPVSDSVLISLSKFIIQFLDLC